MPRSHLEKASNQHAMCSLSPRPLLCIPSKIAEEKHLGCSAIMSSLFILWLHVSVFLESQPLILSISLQRFTRSSKYLQHADVRARQALRGKFVAHHLIGCSLPCSASCMWTTYPYQHISASYSFMNTS
jgi:hypothetical protein